MLNKIKIIFSITLSLFLIFAFNKADAQSTNINNIRDLAEIILTPASPGANENVSLKIESFSFDLNSSEIIWAVNGVIKDKGFGKKVFSFKTGSIGSVSLIKAVIKTKEGETVEKTLVVRPAGVDIIWEADSYTPPFYKGKALYGYQNLVTVIALPNIINSNGVKINPENLIYKWTKDGKVLGGVSGYGKSKFSFSKSILSRPDEIEVEVTSSDKKIKASGNITIEPIEPKVVIYENNPLYGIIYEKAISGEFKLNGNEITLITTPYFFGKNDVGQKIIHDWKMNGRSINNKQDEIQATFRNSENVRGSTKISVDLQNEGKELQSARTDFLLNFEVSDSGSEKKISF